MSHRPFEEWIFTDEGLSPEAKQALHDHLCECESCYRLKKNWARVEQLLAAAPETGPRPGFSGRWLARVEQQRLGADRRQSLAMLAATGAGATLFLFLFGAQLLRQAGEFLLPAAAWVARADALIATAAAAMTSAGAAPISFPPVLPLLAGMGFFAALGAGALVWLKMFRILARLHGLQQWA